MAMWRCPHCGTPQAETSRCWVCRRSSTTCSTCRHFRQSLAAQIGYCGLDRQRLPLAGTEHRGCWTGRASAPAAADEAKIAGRPRPAGTTATSGAREPDALRLRRDFPGFVPLEPVARAPELTPERSLQRPPEPAVTPTELPEPWAERFTLFGDARG